MGLPTPNIFRAKGKNENKSTHTKYVNISKLKSRLNTIKYEKKEDGKRGKEGKKEGRKEEIYPHYKLDLGSNLEFLVSQKNTVEQAVPLPLALSFILIGVSDIHKDIPVQYPMSNLLPHI
jgi:hypothetical protein